MLNSSSVKNEMKILQGDVSGGTTVEDLFSLVFPKQRQELILGSWGIFVMGLHFSLICFCRASISEKWNAWYVFWLGSCAMIFNSSQKNFVQQMGFCILVFCCRSRSSEKSLNSLHVFIRHTRELPRHILHSQVSVSQSVWTHFCRPLFTVSKAWDWFSDES